MFNPFLLSGAIYGPNGLSLGDAGVFPFNEDLDEDGLFDVTDLDVNARFTASESVVLERSPNIDVSQLLDNSAGLMAQALFNLMVDNGHVFDAESSGCACCGHDHGMNAKQEIAALTDQITALLDGGLESIGQGGVLAAIADLGDVDAQNFSNAFQDMAVAAAQSGTGPAANEPNGGDLPADISTTGTIAVGGSATGTRSSGTDEDWFAVDLDQGTTYTFIMLRSGDNPHEDPLLNLYNSSGTLITSNDDIEIDGDTSSAENRNSFITFTATETGTVYLGASGWSTTTGDYTLYAEVGAARPDFTLQESAFFLTSQFDNKSTWNKTALTYDISALSAGAQTLALAAMAEWASVSGLTFTQASGAADITYNENQATDGGAQAFASSTESNGTITSVTVTVSDNWSGDYTFNSYRYQTYLHEVGHALGLGHAGPYNGQNVDAAGIDYHVYNQDAWNYTVMSYRDQADAGTGTPRLVLGAQVVDIIAIQDLYGANAATRTGDSVYGFNSTETGILDFEGTFFNQGIRPPSLSIYDAGGTDTLDFSGYSANQTISLVEGSFSSIGDNTNTADTTDALVNLITIAVGTVIENAKGGSGNDTFVGNGADNVFTGNGGNDTYAGGAGNDTVIFSLAQGSYTITKDETNGQQLLTISGGSDGTDQIDASNIEFIGFSNGAEQVTTASFFAPPATTFTSGDDVVTGTDADDVFDGLGGNDTISGLGGNDSLTGGSGDDTLIGGTGRDALNGGTGVDTASYVDATARVGLDLASGVGAAGEANGDTYSSIENITGSAFNDVVFGDAQNNVLTGLAGNDDLRGADGNDTLIGGAGDDSLNGGGGQDTAVFALASVSDYTIVQVSAAEYQITATSGDEGTDVLRNIETVRIGGTDYAIAALLSAATPGDDTLTGTAGVDTIDGLAGNDTINGLGGNDTLIGGSGDDTLIGGTGRDALNGGIGVDTASYVDTTARVGLDLASGVGAAGEANGDTYSSIENITGSAFNDVVFGDAQNNVLTGLAGNDDLRGADGNDTLIGGAGDDSLNGGGGQDTAVFALASVSDYTIVQVSAAEYQITATSGDEGTDVLRNIETVRIGGTDYAIAALLSAATPGDDTLTGTAGVDTIDGLAGNDTINGLGGNDTLIGGSGDDTLIGGTGRDALNGGIGVDTASYVDATARVGLDLASGVGAAGEANGDTYSSIENITGSAFNDVVFGDAQNNVLTGLAGNDDLRGADGNDTLIGGAGDDSLNGGGGQDTAVFALASVSDYTIVQVSAAEYQITATSGDEGTDVLRNIETVRIGGTDYAIAALLSAATPGDDTLTGTAGVDTIDGLAGNDTINGLGGNDTLIGGSGDDTLIGGTGRDALNGGIGVDTASYVDATARVGLDLASGVGAAGEANGDTYSSIENITGSAFNDVVFGDAQNNVLTGLAGNDDLRGADGNDTLIGGTGRDALNGGIGVDTASYVDATARVGLDLASGVGAAGEANGDTYSSIENITGSAFNDVVFGDAQNNVLTGLAGNDDLRGADGNDTLIGGAGDDSLNGGGGQDTAVFALASVSDYTIVQVSAAEYQITATSGDEGTDVLRNIETVRIGGTDYAIAALLSAATPGDDTLTGTAGVDTIDGLAGNDTINGLGGNDTLIGGSGDDTLIGGTGRDALNGGIGVDTASYVDATARVGLDLASGVGAAGEANGDTYSSIENITGSAFNDVVFGDAQNNVLTGLAGNDDLRGADGNDTLIGGAGDDSLQGGVGDDQLNGGPGNDILMGGVGSDCFVFDVTAGKHDIVMDFVLGSDVIDLESAGTSYDSFSEIMAVATQVGANTVFDFSEDHILTLADVQMNMLTAAHFDLTSSANLFKPELDAPFLATAGMVLPETMDLDLMANLDSDFINRGSNNPVGHLQNGPSAFWMDIEIYGTLNDIDVSLF